MAEARVIINPGAGPVSDSTEANAEANMAQFVADSPLSGLTYRRAADLDNGGRYGFLVQRNGEGPAVEVQMPGVPLERVRYMGTDGCFDLPRLYVNGSSYWWLYGLLDAAAFAEAESNA
jgi:hypothetical protein